MNIWGWLGQRIGLDAASKGFWGGFYGVENSTGETVTPQRAMQLSAVWRGVKMTAETIASLPRSIFVDDGTGPVAQRGSQVDTLIRVSPNADQTPMEFWEQIVGCMELVGEGMARKHWNVNRTRVVALTLMDPTRARDVDNASGNGWRWEYTDAKGRKIELAPDDVLHVPNFSLGGRRGLSPVTYGCQTMGLALAAQKTAGKLFGSGLRSSGFLETGQVLNDPDRKRLEKIMAEYMGTNAAGSLMILEGGMKFTPMNMSAQDAELLLTRKFEIEEIGRWLGMPPILLGHAVDGQTMWGSGVTAIIESWLTLGLRQRIRRVEEVIQKRLMTPDERAAGLYAKFNPDALLAINSSSRISFLTAAVGAGLLTIDEARALLERPNIEGGDQAIIPMNLAPLASLGQNSTPEAQAREALRSWLGVEGSGRENAPSDD